MIQIAGWVKAEARSLRAYPPEILTVKAMLEMISHGSRSLDWRPNVHFAFDQPRFIFMILCRHGRSRKILLF